MENIFISEIEIKEQFQNKNFYESESLDIDGKIQTVYILIPPIIVAAAAELAKAFAARLGEKIAEEIFKNGLTGNNAAFEQEVIKQLAELNKKIEQVINFIYRELPELIGQQLSSELLRQKYIELETDLTLLRGAVATLRKGKLTSDDYDAARRASEQVAKVGEHLLRNGIEWHAAGVHAMSGLISIHSRLMSFDKKYGISLGIYASQYAELIKPWLDPNNPKSVINEISRRKDQLKFSERIINAVTESPEFLFVVNEYYRDEKKIWVGFSARFHKNGDAWSGEWTHSGRGLENSTSLAQFGWTVFDDKLYHVPIGPVTKEGMWDYFNLIAPKFNEAQTLVNILPNKINELENTEATLKSLLACCEKLIPLSKL